MESTIDKVVFLVLGAVIGFVGQYLTSRLQNQWAKAQKRMEQLEALAAIAYEVRDITSGGILSNMSQLMQTTRKLIARLGVNIHVHNPIFKEDLAILTKDLNSLLTTKLTTSSGHPSPELSGIVKDLFDHTDTLLAKIETESKRLR